MLPFMLQESKWLLPPPLIHPMEIAQETVKFSPDIAPAICYESRMEEIQGRELLT